MLRRETLGGRCVSFARPANGGTCGLYAGRGAERNLCARCAALSGP